MEHSWLDQRMIACLSMLFSMIVVTIWLTIKEKRSGHDD